MYRMLGHKQAAACQCVCVCVSVCLGCCVVRWRVCLCVCLCVYRVLCSTVQELVAKLAVTSRDDDTASVSSKCSVLNQKLDALIKTLHDESHASSQLTVGGLWLTCWVVCQQLTTTHTHTHTHTHTRCILSWRSCIYHCVTEFSEIGWRRRRFRIFCTLKPELVSS